MKNIIEILNKMESSLNSSLDNIELDNMNDVIEKSIVIEMLKNLIITTKEAQQAIKKYDMPCPIDPENL